jgi:hypothetical protein
VPYNIITDNEKNFTSKEFKSYCESMGIKLKFAYAALILLVDVGDQRSLCVVNDQLVGNPKRKV